MSEEIPQIIKKGSDVFKYVDGGVIHGYVKTNAIPEQNPFIEWKGEKMPHSLWQAILSFFNWTFLTTLPNPDEALVRIYYNETANDWLAWAPPQRGCGMTVNTITDHANWAQEQEFDGYYLVGTGHHHCKAKAFQSGTDHGDEKLCNGLHFTVGELDKAFVSLHARAVFNGNMQEVRLSDWIDLADKYKQLNLPWELIDRAYDYSLMTKPPKETPFPEIWKENFIRYTSYNQNQGSMGFNGGHQGHVSHHYSKGYYKDEWHNGICTKVWVSTEEKKQEPTNGVKDSNHATGGVTLTPSMRGEMEMENLLIQGKLKLIDIICMLDDLKGPRKDWPKREDIDLVTKVLDSNGLNRGWLEKWCAAEEDMLTNAWQGCT